MGVTVCVWGGGTAIPQGVIVCVGHCPSPRLTGGCDSVCEVVNWSSVTTMRGSTEIERGVKRVSGGAGVLTDWTHRQVVTHCVCCFANSYRPWYPPLPPNPFIRLLRRLRASCRSTRQQWTKSTPRQAANTTQTPTVRGADTGVVGDELCVVVWVLAVLASVLRVFGVG